jgi:hypothetical protein
MTKLSHLRTPPLFITCALFAACSVEAPTPPHEIASRGAGLQRDRASDTCRPGGRRAERELEVKLLGRYAANLPDFESSAETAALQRDRLYVTNAMAAKLDVVDVADPEAPSLLRRVDLSAYGPAVQSVDVSASGLVAVAVRGAAKTDHGSVVFLSRDGAFLRRATVGALPDMVVFSNDGKTLVVANEGEPDCYGAGCTDPEGSVSIIDVYPLRQVLPVRTVSFDGVALPADVRLSGPGARPAQDLEPEYVTISDDDRTAYVTLQENNAVAVVDLKRAKVRDIHPLGYKDHSAAPSATTFELIDLPSIGQTAGGQDIKLGGFSGLFFEGRTCDGKLKFVTHTDRGPNAEPTGSLRPFLLPDFVPQIVRLEVDPDAGRIRVTERIELTRADGSPLSGLSNVAVAGGDASSAHNDEIPVDLFGNILPRDPLGADLEGIVVAPDGSFWMCDEYRPAIYHFETSGKLLARLVPFGSHAAAGLPVPASGTAGELGIEALPEVIAQRRQNRGFEAIAMQGGKLYAFVQSPLRNPTSVSNATLNALANVRLVEIDPSTFATRQFIYVLDNAAATGPDDTRADKIGDMAALPGQGFLVLERDDDALPADPASTISKKIYAFSLAGATDITSLDTLYAGRSLDVMTSAELDAVGVSPISKVLHMDLVAAGYGGFQKVEGLALIDATTVAVINDNDFRVAGIVVDQATGKFSLAPGYEPEPEVLGLISTPHGFDASDRDGVINVRSWPVFGMYMPDAIANFQVRGETFLVTANEGDTREYDGYAEEARARSLSALYPGLPEVTSNAQLGRLTVTNTPPGGDLSRPYVFGTRSFSIWNASTGKQVWDSGSDFERHTASAFPLFFNSNHEANDFDSRSDNKGPEPEGVATGKIGRRTFAFVGLERMGGVMIYDVSSPTAPEFVRYINPRDFSGSAIGPDSGAEVVRFIPAAKSPTRSPLMLVSNEISGTVTLWRLDLD